MFQAKWVRHARETGFHGTTSLFATLSSIREKTLFTPVCKKKTPSHIKPHFVDNPVNVRRFRQFLEVRPYKEDSSLSCVHLLVFLFLKVNISISLLPEVRCLHLRTPALSHWKKLWVTYLSFIICNHGYPPPGDNWSPVRWPSGCTASDGGVSLPRLGYWLARW